MINQVLYFFFKKRLLNSKEHYSQSDIVSFYKSFNCHLEDELHIVNFISSSQKKGAAILVIGAGAGREIHQLLNMDFKLYAFEPVQELLDAIDSSVIKISKLNDLLENTYDAIWVTKNLLSLISNQERVEMYQVLKKISSAKTIIFVNGDIFEVNLQNSFKFFLSNCFLRFFFKKCTRGDIIRRNIDFGASNDNLLIYHYFDSEESFKNEVMCMLNLKSLNKMNETFYIGLFK